MADELAQEQAQEIVQSTQPAVSAEVAQMMELSLNGGFPAKTTEETQNTETEQTQEQVTQTETPVFQFQTLTDKFGWQKPEDALTEIEELRNFKANPPKEELKFENEKSQLLVKALQAGEFDKVYDYLDEQRKLDKLTSSEVTKDTATDIIKLSMQLKYKEEGLTTDEIDYKFRKMYGVPKEPIQGELDEDEFKTIHDEWKERVSDIEAGKIIDAKVAKRELDAAKAKLVVPIVEQSVDEDYVQFKKELEQSKTLADEAQAEYKTFTPKSIETKVNFNDEANKIQFDFQFEPDEEGFKTALEAVTNPDKYRERYQNQDGSYNRKRFLEDVYFSMNREKVLMEAMKQAKNATMKQTLLADNNTNNGIGNRQLPQNQEMSELDKQMKASLNGYIPQQRTI